MENLFRQPGPPLTKREAEQIMRVMEPVAKDGGAQLFLQVQGGLHLHHHYDSVQANAVQNAARRLLGPQSPVTEIRYDELLTLFQVRGVVHEKAGDRGIIETIYPHPVKLIFASDE